MLVNRLEAATSRLEDMAMGLDDPSSPKTLNAAAAPEAVAPEPPQPAFPAPPAAPAVPPQIEDFDTLIDKDVRNFVDLGNRIGDLVAEQVRRSNRRSCIAVVKPC
jgi:adenylyl cyclase-associated protein